MKVAVIGAAGYVGGELLRLLDQHPEVSSWVATSRSQAGQRVGDIHPALAGRSEAPFVALAPGEAARQSDVVFLCLEHGQSARLAAEVLAEQPRLVVDLAADFRIRDPRLQRRYYGDHPAEELLGRFVYGLADVDHESLFEATAIAAPGCFATAAQLALHPLRSQQLVAEPALFAVTGSSGSGALPKTTTHHPARAHNLFAYSLFGHRHEGEIIEQWRRWTARPDACLRLMTHSGPFVRGIYLTLHARLSGQPLPPGGAHELVTQSFVGRPFVRVLAEPPQLTHAVGTNTALIHAAQSENGDEIQILVAIDNLVKGAAGQAIQAMNLALGLAETAGLATTSMFPC